MNLCSVSDTHLDVYKRQEFESGVSVAEIAKSIGAGLYKAACAGKVDGEVVDLRTPLTKDCNLEILTFSEEEGKKAYWHTAAHVLAQACLLYTSRCV